MPHAFASSTVSRTDSICGRSDNLDKHRAPLLREYDLIADWYWSDRGRTVGVREALEVAATLRAGSRILELGCGNGVPITEALVRTGCRVIGLDSSIGMLAHFRNTLCGTPVVRGDARQCPFLSGGFDAAISWGMMFHLSRNDQATVLASVSRVLKPGAPFLFTAAEIDGASDAGITGTMNGVTFHYYAVPSYRTLLAEHGFTLVDVHDDPGVSTYFLAHKLR
jgi:cyclopropane fatty-acyl-phospholipid synthase-like methyltransferase